MDITFRPGIRIAYVTTLQNRLSEPVIGTAHEDPIPNRHSDPVGPGLDSEISCPAPGFRSRRAAAAPDAHGFRHAF
ncbi:hypothetical protein Taro_042762, partial [Colocasia esculenta]|nr:hypothetical protein [Colocasia esculenta]